MSRLHVTRPHALGAERAHQLAREWARMAQDKLDMRCRVETDQARTCVHFDRTGAHGTFVATAQAFEVDAKLGLLFLPFKAKFEGEVVRRLEAAIAAEEKKAGRRAAEGR